MKIHKIPTFASCLEEGGVAQVFIVPSPTLKMAPTTHWPIMIEYGFSMPVPIFDLRWTEEGIYATLSFDRTPFETFVPWASVAGISPKGGDFMVSWKVSNEEPNQKIEAIQNPPAVIKPKLSIVR